MIANLLKGISLGRREDMKWGGGGGGGGGIFAFERVCPRKKG